jgi:hypothetical protein
MIEENYCSILRSLILYGRTVSRIFDKIFEDLVEAYHRTPLTVSSRPYIERGLRLAEAGVSVSRALYSQLTSLHEKACGNGGANQLNKS